MNSCKCERFESQEGKVTKLEIMKGTKQTSKLQQKLTNEETGKQASKQKVRAQEN